jgi:hypothetical protein
MDALGPLCRPLKRAPKMGDAFRDPRLKPGATALALDEGGERDCSAIFRLNLPTSAFSPTLFVGEKVAKPDEGVVSYRGEVAKERRAQRPRA